MHTPHIYMHTHMHAHTILTHVQVITYIHMKLNNIYVTEFAKRGLIHASDLVTWYRHNFICE